MGLNLAVLLEDSARRYGDRAACKLGDQTLSYAELNTRADRLAAGLRRRGIQSGERVAIMLPNVLEFPIAYYAALKAGAVVVPMNVLLKEREVSYYLENSGARLLIAWHDYLEHALAGAAQADVEVVVAAPPGIEGFDGHVLLEDLVAENQVGDTVQTEPGDIAVMLYTSGTTGKPKGANLTHSNLLWNSHLSAKTLLMLDPVDIVLAVLPLFHTFGQTVIMSAAFAGGATMVLMPRFDAEGALDLIEHEKVTIFAGVPTMYTALLHAKSAARRDLSGLRLCMSGAAPIARETLRAFEETFGCKILEGYGLSECSPVVSYNPPDRPSKPGSIGTPIWGLEMIAADDQGAEVPTGEVGEIIVRGHCVMAGYHERPDATRETISEDGWLHTGDLARMDEDGYFFIVDRKKDMIIRGGFNVYPREIEEVLYEHPAVMHAAVLGVPDPEFGEEVAAAVVAKPGSVIDCQQLQSFVKDRVAAYKYPRVIATFDELPLGPTGKILKKEIEPVALRARAESQSALTKSSSGA